MSFVLVSHNQNKNIDTSDEKQALLVDRQEQEIELRVQQELEKLRHTILAEAQSAADKSAHAALNPLEQELKNALSSLVEINHQLAAPLAQKEQCLADLILDIAFQLTRHIVGIHVAQDQTPLLHLITKLLNEINNERVLQKQIIIHLSPLDLPFIESNLPEENMILVSDSNIEQGGAILELPSDTEDYLDRTIWDAQLKNRFDILLNALLPLPKGAIK